MTSTGFLLRTNIGHYPSNNAHQPISLHEFIGCGATSESDQVPSYAAVSQAIQ